ncbi:uncharacterized protein [Periplaneta americana]|uniref:uncharacterized protein n=1 Tax=Periplaneta americana TaxID=6978 RepID=UPI0037E87B54
MSPYQMGHTEPSGGVQGAAAEGGAAPDTGSPTPSTSPSVTPSPPPQQEHDNEDLLDEVDMNPSPMLQSDAPDCLPIDHNLPHLLRQVSGAADLATVRDIKLRVISREMSLQRLALFVPNLRELNLDGSCLGSLRDLGCGLTSLHVLRVSRCGLESLDGTFGLTSLRELHASNNNIWDVGPCSSLPHIRLLDLRKNAVDDVSFLEFLNICSRLEDLSLAECPAASKPGYRAMVRSLLPHLAVLDGVPMTQGGLEEDDEIDDEDEEVGDDEEDNDVDASERSDQDSTWSTSHGGASSFRPETPQSPLGRSGGYGDGAVGGSQHSRPDDEAAPPDSSDLSTGTESPDASSTMYLADTSRSMQSSSSDNMLAAKKKTPRRLPVKKRPATAVASPDAASRPLRSNTPRMPRPSSAAAAAADEDQSSETRLTDPRYDSASSLTSGVVVYGNLTAALRSRRKRQDAWVEEETPSGPELEESTSQESAPFDESDRSSDQSFGAECLSMIAQDGSVEGQDVLEESRKWRERNATFRSENRLRWEQEEHEEDEEKLDQAEKNAEKTTELSCSLKDFKAPPCCPHLFTRQKPTHDTLYDADTSSNLEQSPKLSRKNKLLRPSPRP